MSKHAKIDAVKQKDSYADRRLFYVFVSIIIVTVLGVAIFLFIAWYNSETTQKSQPEIVSTITNKPQGYNFNKLKLTYPDIVAWLDVPNTNIALPIVQHPELDYYYLNHNATSAFDAKGAAYIEKKNSSNFEDPVTLVYGHNMRDDSMFSTEHYFENSQFFNDNDKFYVYKPGHKLTYTVVSAYSYDDRHILNSFDFTNPSVRLQYFNSVQNPSSILKNVRSGVVLDENSKLVQLSTCMSDPKLSNQRYLVTGVLSNDEETT